jgi:hypothetical protein
MAFNPLERSIKSAEKVGDEIRDSFARFGTAAHPRGFVLSAYRNAGRGITQALKEDHPQPAVQEVMRGLRVQLQADIRTELADMQALGGEEASRQLSFYGAQQPGISNPIGLSTQLDNAMAAILSLVDAQTLVIRALVTSQAELEQILAVLRAQNVISSSSYWSAKLAWDAFAFKVEQQPRQFSKQAIAGLDERTTDCCLRVHGQVVPLNGKFSLTGFPRFADKMDWSPFHWYCRTSVALYLPAFDNGLTAAMRDGADQILRERAAGGSGHRHPADAFG